MMGTLLNYIFPTPFWEEKLKCLAKKKPCNDTFEFDGFNQFAYGRKIKKKQTKKSKTQIYILNSF